MLTEEISLLSDVDYEDSNDIVLLDHMEWNHEFAQSDALEDFGLLYWLDE